MNEVGAADAVPAYFFMKGLLRDTQLLDGVAHVAFLPDPAFPG
jgi:hypothetical protein